MKCPYCTRTLGIPTIAYVEVEDHGENHFVIECENCKGHVMIFGVRSAQFMFPRKTTEKLSW